MIFVFTVLLPEQVWVLEAAIKSDKNYPVDFNAILQ